MEGRSVSSRGDVSASILREADSIPGTLVAITSHGRGGVFTAMLGSVAREIVQADLTIVQVLPATTRIDPLLAAYDTLDSSYLSSRSGDLKRRFGIEADWEVLYGDPVESIARYLDGRRDVLAVMASRTRTALKAAVTGSVTSEMVQKAGIPIIVQAPVISRRDATAMPHVSHHDGAVAG